MKSMIIYTARVTLALVFYVCCSSVVCCEACKHASTVSLPDENINTVQEEDVDMQYNTPVVDEEDASPLSIGLIRLAELL